jgi:GT2 family glycosyltransferase
MAASVSVVIPTFNRVERLQRVLGALAGQDHDGPLEVIVVSDGSTDGTDEYLTSADVPLPVRAERQDNQGPAAARNRGVEHATGELVVFIDDDVVPAPGLIRAHLDAHERFGDRLVVIGPMADPPDHAMSPWVRWEQVMLAKQYHDMQAGHYAATARQFYTGNASVRRAHLVAAGGFDPRFRRAEDVELAYRLERLGLRFHFEPAAIGYHYAERSFDSWLRNAYDYGRNDVIFARDEGQAWLLSTMSTEFRQRHALSRLATRVCVPREGLRRAAETSVRRLVQLASRLGAERLARYALSGLYGVEYHRGAADELGGSAALAALLDGSLELPATVGER